MPSNPIIVSELTLNKKCRRLLDINGGTALFNLADLANAEETEDSFFVHEEEENIWYELTPRQYGYAIQLLTMGVDYFVNVYKNGDAFPRREYLVALGRGNVALQCGAPLAFRVHLRLKKK